MKAKVAGSPPPQPCTPHKTASTADKIVHNNVAFSLQAAQTLQLRRTPFGFLRCPVNPTSPSDERVRFAAEATTSKDFNSSWGGGYGTRGLMPCRRRFADGIKIAIEWDGSVSVLAGTRSSTAMEQCFPASRPEYAHAISISANGQEIVHYLGGRLVGRIDSLDISREGWQVQDMYKRACIWVNRQRKRACVARFSMPLRHFTSTECDIGYIQSLEGSTQCFVFGNGPRPDYEVSLRGRANMSLAGQTSSSKMLPVTLQFDAFARTRRAECIATLHITFSLRQTASQGRQKEVRRQQTVTTVPMHDDKGQKEQSHEFPDLMPICEEPVSATLLGAVLSIWLENYLTNATRSLTAHVDAVFIALFQNPSPRDQNPRATNDEGDTCYYGKPCTKEHRSTKRKDDVM